MFLKYSHWSLANPNLSLTGSRIQIGTCSEKNHFWQCVKVADLKSLYGFHAILFKDFIKLKNIWNSRLSTIKKKQTPNPELVTQSQKDKSVIKEKKNYLSITIFPSSVQLTFCKYFV